MKVVKHNSNPVDIKAFLHGQLTVVEPEQREDEDWEEVFPEIPEATFRSNLLKFRKKVSAKLFSIEFGKITF